MLDKCSVAVLALAIGLKFLLVIQGIGCSCPHDVAIPQEDQDDEIAWETVDISKIHAVDSWIGGGAAGFITVGTGSDSAVSSGTRINTNSYQTLEGFPLEK